MKKIILVLCGGKGSEREVSLMSGRNVFENIPRDKYSAVLIEIGRDEEWRIIDIDSSLRLRMTKISKRSLRSRLRSVGMTQYNECDLVFIALHGKGGEDGKIQSYFDQRNIKYTCSGARASEIAFNKYKTSRIAEDIGIKVPKTILVKTDQDINLNQINKIVGYPCVVKPNRSGSSVATTIVKNKNQISLAIKKAFKEDSQILIQEYICGRELTCPVLGKTGKKLSTLPVLEITSNNEFFDYDAKYKSSRTIERVPTDIKPEIIKAVERQSKLIHSEIGCSGLTRSDFILSSDNEPYFLEINTIPGLSKMSLCPKSAEITGIGFGELLNAIIFHS